MLRKESGGNNGSIFSFFCEIFHLFFLVLFFEKIFLYSIFRSVNKIKENLIFRTFLLLFIGDPNKDKGTIILSLYYKSLIGIARHCSQPFIALLFCVV